MLEFSMDSQKMKEWLKNMEEEMTKQIVFLEDFSRSITPGHADIKIISDVKVENNGYKSSLKEVALLTAVSGYEIDVKPYDPDLAKNIEKALWDTKLGTVLIKLNIIKFTLPQTTQESINKLKEKLKAKSEEIKVSLRNLRRKYMDLINGFKKTHEDLYRKQDKDIQAILDKYILKATEIFDKFNKKYN